MNNLALNRVDMLMYLISFYSFFMESAESGLQINFTFTET